MLLHLIHVIGMAIVCFVLFFSNSIVVLSILAGVLTLTFIQIVMWGCVMNTDEELLNIIYTALYLDGCFAKSNFEKCMVGLTLGACLTKIWFIKYVPRSVYLKMEEVERRIVYWVSNKPVLKKIYLKMEEVEGRIFYWFRNKPAPAPETNIPSPLPEKSLAESETMINAPIIGSSSAPTDKSLV